MNHLLPRCRPEQATVASILIGGAVAGSGARRRGDRWLIETGTHMDTDLVETEIDADVSSAERFREYAADCINQATGAESPEDKNLFLNMALAWVRLAHQSQEWQAAAADRATAGHDDTDNFETDLEPPEADSPGLADNAWAEPRLQADNDDERRYEPEPAEAGADAGHSNRH